LKICDYGCGQEAKYQFKNGKYCCSPHRNSCQGMIQKNKDGQKKTKFKWSEEERIKMGENRKGKNNGMYGKLQTEKNKELNRQRLKNKTYEELYGVKKAKKLKENFSKKMKGRQAWNKNLKGQDYCTIETLRKWRYSIKQIQKKFPLFAKVEEMRYEPGKEKERVIQVHCKNHNCPNSKEQGGWFTPERHFIFNRARTVEFYDDVSYLYCSTQCKEECPLYGKTISQLIKENTIKEDLYTSEEYQTWRTTVLERAEYLCEYCEEPANHVHHSRPQKLEPGFVLDPDFGVACCESCHYKYGHKTGTECSTGTLANVSCIEK